MKTRQKRQYSAPAVEQACQILFAMADEATPQLSLTEICRRVDISGSKAYGILAALEKTGLVKRGPNGKGYALGPGLVILSRKVIDDTIPSRTAESVLDALTEKTECTSVFGLISGDTIFVAARSESMGELRISMHIGFAMPLTYGAHGKAIVSFFPESERDRILEGKDLYFHEDPEKLDRTLLAKELEQCRRDGYSCSHARSAPGVTVVAAPVFGFTGKPIGFVEIFVFAPEEKACRLGPEVARAGKVLSQQLGAAIDKEATTIPVVSK